MLELQSIINIMTFNCSKYNFRESERAFFFGSSVTGMDASQRHRLLLVLGFRKIDENRDIFFVHILPMMLLFEKN